MMCLPVVMCPTSMGCVVTLWITLQYALVEMLLLTSGKDPDPHEAGRGLSEKTTMYRRIPFNVAGTE